MAPRQQVVGMKKRRKEMRRTRVGLSEDFRCGSQECGTRRLPRAIFRIMV